MAVSDGDGEMPELHSRFAGGCGDAASPPAPPAGFPKVGATDKVQAKKTGASLGKTDDTRGRQVARKHPGSLAASTTVSFARQVGYTQPTGELEAAAKEQRPAVSYLDRALLAHRAEVSSARRKSTEDSGRNI